MQPRGFVTLAVFANDLIGHFVLHMRIYVLVLLSVLVY